MKIKVKIIFPIMHNNILKMKTKVKIIYPSMNISIEEEWVIIIWIINKDNWLINGI